MSDTYTTGNSGASLAHTYDRRTIGKVKSSEPPYIPRGVEPPQDPLSLKKKGQANALGAMERS